MSGHRVDSIEHGTVAVLAFALLDQFVDLPGDPVGFVLGGREHQQLDSVAFGVLRHQSLSFSESIVSDQLIGRSEYGGGAAEVLFEPHHHGVGVVLLESQDVVHSGTSPTVDRLVGVTGDAQVGVIV